jgi:HD-like signal output (HDOD) protein
MIASSHQSVQLQINQIKNLPALPEASVKILEAINDPDIDIRKLVKVIALSPGLVARLLGLANSAFFGQILQIDDLETAVVRVLGLQLVRSLTLGILLNVQLDPKQCKGFDSLSFWTHSLMTAVAAQKLTDSGNNWPTLSAANAYTNGLLLNIGLLVMAYIFPAELDEIVLKESKNFLQIENEIKGIIGLTHYQMGYLLLKKWRLPEAYQTTLQHFDSDDLLDSHSEINRCMHVSQRICNFILDETFEQDKISKIAAQANLQLETVTAVCNALLENRENIQKLASEMRSS